jgi:uncharacterized membrane protein YfcA
MFLLARRRFAWSLGVALTSGVIGGCSGGSGSGVMMPLANSGGPAGSGAVGNTVVRIFVPTTQLSLECRHRRPRRPSAARHQSWAA